ncbi:MAG: ABC-2 transporter permease [Acetatifactor sp.]|nr:ABC-2 transporter permease [Acetatifactor sp.]
MKGLLIKDLMLLKRQKATLVMIVFFVIFLSVNNTLPSAGIVAYVAVFFTMLAISSVSYDEFDNGYAFLFTLPITIKTYVLEKYLFALLAVCGSCLLSGGFLFIGGQGAQEEGFMGFVAGFGLMMFLLIAVMMPLQLKFGVEKSRLMGLLLGILGGGVGVLCMTSFRQSGRLEDVIDTLQAMEGQLNGGVLAFFGVCLVILAYLVSIMVSIHIMKRRDF